MPLPTSEKPYHRQIRNIHKLSNNHILTAIKAERAAQEVDAEGNVVWEYTGLRDVLESHRLSNRKTHIACGKQCRVINLTPDHRVVWEVTAPEVPESNLTWITACKNWGKAIGSSETVCAAGKGKEQTILKLLATRKWSGSSPTMRR